MASVPKMRITNLNEKPVNQQGRFVLYWMTAYRRPFYNFALQRAAELAVERERPLLILEALRCDYPYASDRLHRFILDGMRANAEHFKAGPAGYYPFIEQQRGEGK